MVALRRRRRALAGVAVLGAVLAGGCGVSDPYNDRDQGPAAARTATTAAPAPAPSGVPGRPARTPEEAIRTVALAWGNWTSRTLHAQHRRALALAAGPAAKMLKIESRQLEDGVVSSPDDLTSKATVEAVTVRPGAQRRVAIVVTHERLEGLGPIGSEREYVVTLATVEQHDGSWVVTRWERQS